MFYNEEQMNKDIYKYLYMNDKNSEKRIIKSLYALAKYIITRDKFKNNNYHDTEEWIQNAVFNILNKLDLIDLSKGSSYSYCYKAIYTSILYDIREKNKKKKRLNIAYIDDMSYIGEYNHPKDMEHYEKCLDRIKYILNNHYDHFYYSKIYKKQLDILTKHIYENEPLDISDVKELKRFIKKYKNII